MRQLRARSPFPQRPSCSFTRPTSCSSRIGLAVLTVKYVLRAETAAGKRAYHTIRRCQSVAESCQATDRSPTSHFIDQPIGSRKGETGDVVWNGVWMLFGSNIRLACAKRLTYVLLRISEMYGVIAYFAVCEIGRTWASPSLPSIKVLFKLDLLPAI